jgi:dUTPase
MGEEMRILCIRPRGTSRVLYMPQNLMTSRFTYHRRGRRAQAVRHRSSIAEYRIRSRVNLCGICGGHGSTGTDFL